MKHANSFTLKNHEGTLISLESFQGKWVILYFYPKDNTPGCTTEAVDFTKLKKEHPEIVILGVSPDTPECHKNFIEKQNLSIILLSDPDKEVLNKYGAWGLKKNYGKEYKGVIRSTFLINPNGEIILSWKNVKAKGHAAKVFEALTKLLESPKA
ncbi:MAG: peroxiredoxin [Simkaniaceae bacterium]|jgi:peroxiredoxin Q/BCP|nr:MAG: peroxiredoxin [Simkaniaceae bacterium]